MTFAHAYYFYLLFLLIPMAGLLYGTYMRSFAKAPLFRGNDRLSNRTFYKMVILATFDLLAFFFMVVAAAGPSWGNRYTQEEKQYLDAVLMVDVSRSMLMDDVYPNRLERAQSLVRSLLIETPRIRYALAAVKGGAVDIVPMTAHAETIRLGLETLSPEAVTSEGTDLGKGLRTAISFFPENMETEKALFLFSDGGGGIEGQRFLAEEMKKNKITCYTVAIGTASKEPLKKADGTPFLYREKPVFVPVETAALEDLALFTGGTFFKDGSGLIVNQMRFVLRDRSGSLDRRSYTVENRDDSAGFALAALVCLWVSFILRIGLWRKEI